MNWITSCFLLKADKSTPSFRKIKFKTALLIKLVALWVTSI